MGLYDWSCNVGVTVDNSYSKTQSSVKVLVYWYNNGWNYNIPVVAYTFLNGGNKVTAYDGWIDTTSDNYGNHLIASHTYIVDKGESATAVTYKAGIQGSGYVGSAYKESSTGSTTISALDSYTVSYDANGGKDAPKSGTKYYNRTYTLSPSEPTRTDGSTTGYTVNFNLNGASGAIDSVTSTRTITYSFTNWKSSYDGGTYSPGSSYTVDAATTMVAQWASTYVNNNITLPQTSRLGYLFSGWYTSSSGGTRAGGAGDAYAPSENITLYARWEPQASEIITATSSVIINKDPIKISWVPYNTSFTFKIKLSIGTWSYETGVISPRSTDTQTREVITRLPDIVANQITTETPGAVSVILYTYSDEHSSALLGTSTATVVAIVPDEPTYYPTIKEGYPVITQGLYSSTVDAFVQSLSSIKSIVSANGAYGSLINGITMVVSQGIKLIATITGSFTPDETITDTVLETLAPINVSGDITINISIVDSRKRSCTYTQNIKVHRYGSPFAEISLDADTASATAKGTIYPINNKIGDVDNVLNRTEVYWVRHKVSDGESVIHDVRYPPGSGYIDLRNDEYSDYNASTGSFTTTWIDDPGDLLTETYKYTVYVQDIHYSLPFETISAIPCFSRFAGGKGVRFFGEAYKEGFMIGDIDYTFTNEGFIQFATDLAIQFDSENEVWIHQFVIHNNILYECIELHSGEWDSSHFRQIASL